MSEPDYTPDSSISPHFSPGSREQVQEVARQSHQMDEPSHDLWTRAPKLIAPAAFQPYDFKDNCELFNTFPTYESLHISSPLLKRHGA